LDFESGGRVFRDHRLPGDFHDGFGGQRFGRFEIRIFAPDYALRVAGYIADDYERDDALRADGLGMTHYGYDFAYFLRNFGDMRSYFHFCLLCVVLRCCK